MLALCGLYFFIALQDTLAVSAMNEDTLHIEKTDSLVPFFWPMYLRWSCYALLWMNGIRSCLSPWQIHLHTFLAALWLCPPLGGRNPVVVGLGKGMQY